MKKPHFVAGLVIAVLMLAPLVVRAETITRLTLTGPAGEYISQGQTLVFTPADGPFLVSHDTQNGIYVWFHTPSYSHFWTVQIGGPNKSSPQVGTYTDCVRYGFDKNGEPGLAVTGDGRGCNESHGEFTVRHVVYDAAGAVSSLWVTFTQYCDNQLNPLTGELIFQMDASTPTRSKTWGQLKTIYR